MPTETNQNVVASLMARVKARAGRLDLSAQEAQAVADYYAQFDSPAAALASEPARDQREPSTPSTMNLRVLPGETYFQLCQRVANEQCRGDLREAHRRCQQVFPVLAAAWEDGTAL